MKYVVFLLAAFTLTFSLKAQISDTQVANKDSSMSTMNSIGFEGSQWDHF